MHKMTPQNNPRKVGQWELLPYDSQIEAVHMSVLSTGKILYYSGFRVYEAIPTETRLWNPETGEIKKISTPGDLFCAGHSFLSDGRVVSTGGTLEYRNLPPFPPWLARLLRPVQKTIAKIGGIFYRPHAGMEFSGSTFVYLFDPHKEQWEFAGDMKGGRWYPTVTSLPDGNVLILSGFDEGGGVGKKDPPEINRRVEIFDKVTGLQLVAMIPVFQSPGAEKRSPFHKLDFPSDYPRMIVLPLQEEEKQEYPSGKVFCAGYAPQTKMLNLKTWEWKDVDHLRFGMRHDGCAVLLPLCPPDYRARVLHFGGSIHGGMAAVATNTAELIDFGEPKPTWKPIRSAHEARVNGGSVMLPDGNILAVSGNSTGRWDDLVLACELFNPETNTWRRVAPISTGRGYHATAILLPDGRVLSTGSTPLGPMQLQMEVYSPPYLFKGPRPVVEDVQASITYGTSFSVAYHYKKPIEKAVLMAPGSMTHSFDMHQRYVELVIAEQQEGNRISVIAPPDCYIAPPGQYMLFLLSGGVPSKAVFVELQ